jgi:hypothetical protein
VGAVQIGRLRPISPAEGNLGNYPWPRHFQKLAELIEREFGGFVSAKMFDD